MRVCVCVHLCVWSHTVHRKYIAMFSASKSASKAYTVFLNVLQKKKNKKRKNSLFCEKYHAFLTCECI